ncbi:Replication-associated recombination protein A [Planctomycetales bacterium 10988]|nr:Replication-associated recombination protein A [Planctomycetales bacterium 10988]
MSLFENEEAENLERVLPLAARMRPRTLEEFIGQQHFLAPGQLLWRMIKSDRLGSLIFYGPPGTGKTSLARLLASETNATFQSLNATESSTAEVRKILQAAHNHVASGGDRTLLFLDEIHRFNKAQQDVLLPAVENGTLILVGATTQNPSFALTNAIVSRSRLFRFEPLSVDEVKQLLQQALTDKERGFGKQRITLTEEAANFLAANVDGDARQALSALEIGVLSSLKRPLTFDLALARESLQRKALPHDATGDEHYDVISALIKSVRGSDPDAAIYWLARMLEAGEEVRFLARRLVILASEDIGNADPQALPLAMAAWQACEAVGLPECEFALAQATIYLALAPKSNACTVAIRSARKDVRENPILPVPKALRDGHSKAAREAGHGEGYLYPHNDPRGVLSQDYLGEKRTYYDPPARGFERTLQERLAYFRQILSGEETDSESNNFE